MPHPQPCRRRRATWRAASRSALPAAVPILGERLEPLTRLVALAVVAVVATVFVGQRRPVHPVSKES